MDMSHEERLLRRIAKLFGGDIDVWTSQTGHKCVSIYLCGRVFGPYATCTMETPHDDVWKIAASSVLNSTYVHNRIGTTLSSSVEELEIRLAAAGV